jgi:hypothetical protein
LIADTGRAYRFSVELPAKGQKLSRKRDTNKPRAIGFATERRNEIEMKSGLDSWTLSRIQSGD